MTLSFTTIARLRDCRTWITISLFAVLSVVWGCQSVGSDKTLIAYATTSSDAPTIDPLDTTFVQAQQGLEIRGTGFSEMKEKNTVTFLGDDVLDGLPSAAQVLEASAMRLLVLVPFRAMSGHLQVEVTDASQPAQSSEIVTVETSISGLVQTADTTIVPRAIKDVLVTVVGRPRAELSNVSGVFILPEIFDASETHGNSALPFIVDGANVGFGTLLPKMRAQVRCNNHYRGFLELQRLGQPVPTPTPRPAPPLSSQGVKIRRAQVMGSADNVRFELSPGGRVSFSNNTPSRILTLAEFPVGHFPVAVPQRLYSSVVAQLMPLGATFQPGAKLVFANLDGLPPNQEVPLYRLDQKNDSPSLGRFTRVGVAKVSADAREVSTASTTIQESGYYFVSPTWPTATVTGRVVESDQQTSAVNALVVARGQFAYTNKKGEFTLPEVPVLKTGDQVSLEVSLLRPDGVVDRAAPVTGIAIKANGVSTAPPIILPPHRTNYPPTITGAPASLALGSGETRTFLITVSDRESSKNLKVQTSGTPFVSIRDVGEQRFEVKLAPNASGDFIVLISATDELGAKTVHRLTVRVSD